MESGPGKSKRIEELDVCATTFGHILSLMRFTFVFLMPISLSRLPRRYSKHSSTSLPRYPACARSSPSKMSKRRSISLAEGFPCFKCSSHRTYQEAIDRSVSRWTDPQLLPAAARASKHQALLRKPLLRAGQQTLHLYLRPRALLLRNGIPLWQPLPSLCVYKILLNYRSLRAYKSHQREDRRPVR